MSSLAAVLLTRCLRGKNGVDDSMEVEEALRHGMCISLTLFFK